MYSKTLSKEFEADIMWNLEIEERIANAKDEAERSKLVDVYTKTGSVAKPDDEYYAPLYRRHMDAVESGNEYINLDFYFKKADFDEIDTLWEHGIKYFTLTMKTRSDCEIMEALIKEEVRPIGIVMQNVGKSTETYNAAKPQMLFELP